MKNNAFEKYFAVRDPKKYSEDDVIRPGKSISFDFDLEDCDLSARHRLFFTGETQMFYMWKNEPDAKKMYYEIEDALNSENAERARYCLDLSMRTPKKYTKRVVYETKWPPKLSYLRAYPDGEECLLSIFAKAKDLKLAEGKSYLRYMLEIWEKREDNPDKLTNRPADKKYVIDIPEGSYPMKKLELPVEISKDNTAYIAVTVEGLGYSGNIYVENPSLFYYYHGNPVNVLPNFNTAGPNSEFFDWLGMNISKKEWPEFNINLNGECIYDDEIFERCHRYAEMEVAIPEGILKKKGNTLTFTLNSEYNGTLPYGFREIAILEQPGGHPFEIIAIPEVADCGKDIPILIRTERENLSVKFECEGGELVAPSKVTFENKGLNVLKIKAEKPCNNADFRLVCDGYAAECRIPRMIERDDDKVITGTSDQVYISQNYDEVEEYLSWYIANGVGNFLTSRPIYRWGGARVLEPESWAMETRILNDMGIKYAHMTEGRDLPGIEVNPSVEMLEGEHFLGRQMHEKDGQMYYWGTNIFGATRMIDMYFNLAQRIFMEKPEYTDDTFRPENYTVINDGVTWPHAVNIDNDMKKTGDDSVEKLSIMRNGNPRHTGPSIMSRYFYNAGFDFFGAELMYGSMETNVCFLRGSAKAYGKDRFGAHHAMQWSSSPHDAEEKYRRYRLALYVGYMQGITDINTEEGLWHIEEYYSYFNRFTDACKAYLKQQQDFTRYVVSHSRRGRYYSPMAYVHGRYDGMLGFGKNKSFGIRDFKDCDAEKSWEDLLKLFYPLSRPNDPIYYHNCPAEAVGYYSGTPSGNVDSVPLEGGTNVLPEYKAISFVGYNFATAEDMDTVYDYVLNGGTVVLSWPHLSITTNRNDIVLNKFEIIKHPFVEAITEGDPIFESEVINGNMVDVCSNLSSDFTVLEKTEAGMPLKAEKSVGKGKIVLINAKAYPHHPAVSDIFVNTVKEINSELIAKENVWIECGNDVEFTVYDREDGKRDIYVLAVDWYNSPETMRSFTLRIGKHRYSVEIPFGIMLKITAMGDKAAFVLSENAETDFDGENTVTVQGAGDMILKVAQNGAITDIPMHFGNSHKLNISI
jgi:hypothetical protein